MNEEVLQPVEDTDIGTDIEFKQLPDFNNENNEDNDIKNLVIIY